MRPTLGSGRSLAAATGVLGVMIFAVGGLGVAAAANGGSLALGKHNHATKMTTLANSKGTALALKAGKGKPALSVNTKAEVKRLNAAEVDGSTAAQLKTAGSGVITNYGPGTGQFLVQAPSAVASTGKLAAGTYYVTASVVVQIPPSDSALCEVSSASSIDSDTAAGQALSNAGGTVQTLTVTEPVVLKAAGAIHDYCWLGTSTPTDKGYTFNAGLTAIRVDSSTPGTAPEGQSLILTRHKH